MEKTIKFKGCEHLDYSGDYPAAKKEPVSIKGVTKICWKRRVIDQTFPSLVQFCKLRGRLNNPEMCLCEETKECSDFNEIEHEVNY